jgi:hypothetical protein
MDEDTDVSIFNIDWASLSEIDKSAIIIEHIKYVNLSRKAVEATGSYTSNIRSLFMMMILTLTMSLQSFENKTIIIAVIGSQFLKTLFSRVFENTVFTSADEAKKHLLEFMIKKTLKNR